MEHEAIENITENDAAEASEPLVLVSALAFGQNVERLRKEAGLGKTALCMMAGISRPTLNKFEKGVANPKLQYVESLAVALGTTPWDLIRPAQDADELFRDFYQIPEVE